MAITVKVKNGAIVPCPKCGNSTEFKIHSRQCAEDHCEVWSECKCGYDPTAHDSMERLESVWGGTDYANAKATLHIWNDLLQREAV